MTQRMSSTSIFSTLGDEMDLDARRPEELVDGLMYEQGIHSLYSPGGSGKTILALWHALRVMEQGLRVCYVDEENGRWKVIELLQQMGADREVAKESFSYAHGPGLTMDSQEAWMSEIERLEPALVVFDSLADMLALSGLNENDAGDVTKWVKAFAEPVKDMGGAVLILDHVTKDDSGKFARGSTAKHAKVDVAWKLKVEKPFHRDAMGEVKLTLDKDRNGCLPLAHTFKVGGDGFNNLTVEPGEILTSRQDRKKGLTGSKKVVFEALQDGMTYGEWKEASMQQGLKEPTFKSAKSKVFGEHVQEVDGKFYRKQLVAA